MGPKLSRTVKQNALFSHAVLFGILHSFGPPKGAVDLLKLSSTVDLKGRFIVAWEQPRSRDETAAVLGGVSL